MRTLYAVIITAIVTAIVVGAVTSLYYLALMSQLGVFAPVTGI